MDDPSGYSTIENLHLPFPDPKLEIRYYGRTKEQNEALGLQHDDQATIKDDLAAGDGTFQTFFNQELIKTIFRWSGYTERSYGIPRNLHKLW